MMTKRFQDYVSFAVMTILIFIILSLSFTSLTGSSGNGIRYLDLHWIVLRDNLYQVLTVTEIHVGTLATLIAASLCLTWILSKVLKLLRDKNSSGTWLIFTLVIVIYLMFASMQRYAFT
jgi:hypothetical protein